KWDVFYVLDQAMTELVTSVDARAAELRAEAKDADRTTAVVASLVTAFGLALGLVVALVVSRGMVRGVREIQAGLERVADGALSVGLPVRGGDELGQTAA